MGDSSGGMIAQRVALDYPHRVSRLVLIGSPTTLLNNEAVMEARECVRWKIPSRRVRQAVYHTEHDFTPGSGGVPLKGSV